MKTRYELAINGTQLHDLSDRIMILDISHGAARTEIVSNNIPNRNGQRVAGRYVRSVSVTVTFEIHTPDIEERQRVMDSIVSLASEAEYITTNDKPEKVLYAVCDTPPAIDSVLKWTKPIKMTSPTGRANIQAALRSRAEAAKIRCMWTATARWRGFP